MRTLATKQTAINQYNGFGNQLWDIAGTRPSLDLQFSDRKDLVDATTGSNLVDFTRASSGTYVGSDGLIKTATTNLLLQSEDLTVSPWSPSPTVTVTADNNQGEPFSGASVYKIEFTGINQSVPQNFTYLAAEYVASFWIKGTPGETIRFSPRAGQVAFNYTLDGTWQYINTDPIIAVAGTSNFSWNTFGTATARTIYVAAPQLEQSDTVGEYVKTTSTINSAPRFDHDPTTGESLGLLVEESRTNLILNSDTNVEFANPSTSNTWTSGEIAPDGSATAKICTTNNRSFIDYAASGTADSPITYFVYLKATSSISRQLQLRKFGSDVVVTDIPSITLTTEWQRFEITGTSNTDGARIEILGGIENISAWGAQLEEGSFPTSYIPTEGSAVTRAADVASITGTNFSSWYRQDEGTVFVDASSTRGSLVGFSNGTSTERYRLNANTTAMAAFGTSGGNTQFNINTGTDTWISPARGKGVLALGLNNVGISANGSSVTPDNSATAPIVNRMFIGNSQVATTLNGALRRITYWPARLPDSTLQGITQE